MKQAIVRKTLANEWTAYEFETRSRFFYVKNLSSDNCFVSFEPDTPEVNSFLIPSMHAEEVAMTFSPIDRNEYYTNTIYVKGTGDVEVQAMDIVEG